jgi:hypothetical protein
MTTPFLVGGTAFSGTTLLTLLLDQAGLVCLDEPDFQKFEQRHRCIPVLRRRFPDVAFPPVPERSLDHEEAFDLFRACAAAVSPTRLGFKTCNADFVIFGKLFRDAGFPVVAIVRDIRDVLARPLDYGQTELSLNRKFRFVWENLGIARTWVRYEDLVRDTNRTMAKVLSALGHDAEARAEWTPDAVTGDMLKNERHELLKQGSVSSARVGLWRTSGATFSAETMETVRMMGYGD